MLLRPADIVPAIIAVLFVHCGGSLGCGVIAAPVDPPPGTASVACFDKNRRLLASLEDTDSDGEFETRSFFAEGRLSHQEIRLAGELSPWQIIHYNPAGHRQEVELDTDRDGRMDQWQYYRGEAVIRLESDRDRDGSKDLRVIYSPEGSRKVVEEDRDGDGIFEMVSRFDTPGWSSVTIFDSGSPGRPISRVFNQDDRPRERHVDWDRDGETDLIEYFSESGALLERCEFLEGDVRLSGPCPIRYVYTSGGTGVDRAERDRDGDGHPDEWFFYSEERLSRVEDDSDRDGRVDIWEYYDEQERITRRERDLDMDGTPDVTE